MTVGEFVSALAEHAGSLFAVGASVRALVNSRAARVAADASAVQAVVQGLEQCKKDHAAEAEARRGVERMLEALRAEFETFRKETTR